MQEVLLTTEVVRDQARLDALADEWAALYAQLPAVTPFQTHAWLASWARSYCPPGRLRVITVREAGRLVAVAPLYATRRSGVTVLTPLGGEITDFRDLLLPSSATEVWDALTRALIAESPWEVIDLPELRPDASALPWIASWPGRITRLEGDVSLELPVQPLPTLLSRASGRTANVLRRKLRKIDALGVSTMVVPPDQAADAVAVTLALHKEQWRDRGINSEHLTRRFAVHLAEAVAGMVAQDQARVIQFFIDDELLASQIDMNGHRFFGYYFAGVSPKLKGLIDVAALQLRTDLELALSAGAERYSMMRGDEDYKQRLRPEVVMNSRILLSRPNSLAGMGFPTAAWMRAAAARWARQHAPWLRRIRRTLRIWVARRGT